MTVVIEICELSLGRHYALLKIVIAKTTSYDNYFQINYRIVFKTHSIYQCVISTGINWQD